MDALNVMTLGVTTIGPDASIEQAHSLMLSMGARHLPVVVADRLVGILSDRDVLLCAGHRSEQFVYPKLRVEDRMTSAPVTASMRATLRELAELMLEHKIDAVPIVTRHHELLGLVTSTDLLKVVSALGEDLALVSGFKEAEANAASPGSGP